MPHSRLAEVFTGRLRPRHKRFYSALSELCKERGLDFSASSLGAAARAVNVAKSYVTGVRAADIESYEHSTLPLLHHSLSHSSRPYIAEFDIPVSIHQYSAFHHHYSSHIARKILESPNLRGLLVFSDWARSSFGLYYGPTVEAKTYTMYPLASTSEVPTFQKERYFDFAFIASSFDLKAGPLVVDAFNLLRKSFPNSKLCLVTSRKRLEKNYPHYFSNPGLTILDSSLSEAEVTSLLSTTKCLVHPTFSDSFGMVVLEAISCGCSIICSNFASFPELVDSSNGILLDTPCSSVSNLFYISSLGKEPNHLELLSRLSFDNYRAQIQDAMLRHLSSTRSCQQMQEGSVEKYNSTFSKTAWCHRMNQFLDIVL